jgi:hypothetical protein
MILADLMCVPLAHAAISAVLALSTYFVIDRSWKFALPEPPPLPEWKVPEFDRPQLHARMSTLSLCFASTDSPLMPSSSRNISTAMRISCSFVCIV